MKLKSDCVITKPCILRTVRNEYGKKVRKKYEKGMITEQRHNMKEYEPRTDGISNTISTVQKDNYLIEPKIHKLCNLRAGASGMKDPSVGRVYGTDGIAPSILSRDYKDPKLIAEDGTEYRIRKLTPKECFRLMGVSDTDIEKICESGVSKTQQYKLAGNSIVVDVMAYIFANLFAGKLRGNKEVKFTPPLCKE